MTDPTPTTPPPARPASSATGKASPPSLSQVLSSFKVEDPPADLLVRTLQRVREQRGPIRKS